MFVPVSAVDVRRAALDAILRHARAETPRECCGLLVGSTARIASIHHARNLHESPTRYRIDPADHFAALRAAEARGLDVVGAYHSHPAGAAVPSQTDRDEATFPEYLYLIASLVPEVGLRGYRLVGHRAEEVELTLVP